MTYKGMVKNGTVVLESAATLPDGTEVDVALPSERGAIWSALQDLPGSASFEDVIEQVYLLYKIERGVRQLDAGQGVPHDEARRRFAEWLD